MTIAISGTTGITLDGQFNSASSMGFKNRIINGGMVIDQRNAGASVTPTDGQYTLDRWTAALSQSSKYTIQQSTTVPAGFKNSLLVTSSSAYSVSSSDFFFIGTKIEGLNIADLGWGAVGASSVTLSFWVRSSLTGTFGGALRNSGASRCYPFTYTISAANTWEQKSLTISGDTSGTWLTTNGIGIEIDFNLGTGTTYSGTSNAWASSNYVSATGATSVVGTNGATFYITGVQLEKGSTATSFDYRPYGTELALCQRYYQIINAMSGAARPGGTTATMMALFFVTMRSAPTVAAYGGVISITEAGVADYSQSSTSVVIESSRASSQGAQLAFANFSGLTSQRPNFQNVNGNGAAFSAEL